MAEATALRRRAVSSAILAGVALVTFAAAYASYLLGRDAEPTVTIGGPFALTTHSGATLSDTDLRGKPFAVFFGFTHCPEVCPTTLWELSEALKALGLEADRLQMLFISVDPERDTPEFLARYLESFDPRIVGLTGTEAELAAVGRAYRAYWEKIPTGNGDYTMNHTASIFLMDAKGAFAGTIAYEEKAEVRVEKLRRLIAGGSA
ncbi:SCO family protein [Mesorhizobium sp. L-8-3]|uniref:SCO family protein n=1 Tax=Mesorhizobium sp. L-8-3 TaxID=2744522 RepID=UPI001FD05A34|nr:SCO family protein [Mesorhizobium sp. L-8-3]